MQVYRTIVKKVFWELDFIKMQILSYISPLFCTSTWPSHHVRENKEYKFFFRTLGKDGGVEEKSIRMERNATRSTLTYNKERRNTQSRFSSSDKPLA